MSGESHQSSASSAKYLAPITSFLWHCTVDLQLIPSYIPTSSGTRFSAALFCKYIYVGSLTLAPCDAQLNDQHTGLQIISFVHCEFDVSAKSV